MNAVSNAVDSIQDNLKDGWFDGVTPGELRENTQILEDLTPEQTNDAISELSDGDLDKWTDEIYDGKLLGIIGDNGLSVAERTDLYQNLARDLEPDQLERVYDALGSADRQAEFVSAIATHASDDTKVALIERLAEQTTDNPFDTDAGFGSVSTRHSDQDATTVSTLIGSLDSPSSIDRAINALDKEQLEAVLHAGIDQRSITVSGGFGASAVTTHLFDTSGFTDLIDAVGRSNDADVQSRVFELGARQIDEIRDTDSLLRPNPGADDAAGEVANALADLLTSNTGDIVTSLETGAGESTSTEGNGLSAVAEELVRQEDIPTLQNLIAKLQAGDDLDQNPREFLSRFTTDEFDTRDFQNASNLGYLVGAIERGIDQIQSDRQEQADTLTTIFGTGLGLVPGGSFFSKAAITLSRPLSSELINAVADDLASDDIDLARAFQRLALPDDVTGSDVTGPYNEARRNVVD